MHNVFSGLFLVLLPIWMPTQRSEWCLELRAGVSWWVSALALWSGCASLPKRPFSSPQNALALLTTTFSALPLERLRSKEVGKGTDELQNQMFEFEDEAGPHCLSRVKHRPGMSLSEPCPLAGGPYLPGCCSSLWGGPAGSFFWWARSTGSIWQGRTPAPTQGGSSLFWRALWLLNSNGASSF